MQKNHEDFKQPLSKVNTIANTPLLLQRISFAFYSCQSYELKITGYDKQKH